MCCTAVQSNKCCNCSLHCANWEKNELHPSPEAAQLGGNPTQHADEKGLVNQFVALRVHQVELERQAASLLPFLMAVLQLTYGGEAGVAPNPISHRKLILLNTNKHLWGETLTNTLGTVFNKTRK